MAGNCHPPFTCGGRGGYCNCNCRCLPPSPCFEKIIYTYHILDAPLFEPCPGIVSYDVTIEITTTGCCLYRPPNAGYMKAIGDGELTISPGCFTDYQCRQGNPMDSFINLTVGGDTFLIKRDTTGCGNFTIPVLNCTPIEIGFGLEESNCCYYSTSDIQYVLLDDKCSAQAALAKKGNLNTIKQSVLSRIKKVHYKP